MLRAATKTGILHGWYFYGWGEWLRYVLNPPDGPPVTHTPDGTVEYCRMLQEAGVEPLYVGQR